MIQKSSKNNLKEVAQVFFKLGCIGFGGPAAHIAMMRDEVVVKRKWMTEEYFLDLIGATNLIPGPNSTEMAIHVGHERAGWKGLIVAGLCFILPAVFITGFFAWLYKKYGQLPQVEPFIYGIKPAIIAIIIAAVYPLLKKSLKTFELGIFGFTALLLSLSGVNELLIMFGAGFFALLLMIVRKKGFKQNAKSIFPFTMLQIFNTALLSVTNTNLFFIFLKIGAILYGSGYVLFAFIDTELVATGLLTKRQLIDAIAVGQFTPGPVFSSVTFIGYQINGLGGAIISTIGIFLPSFIFVALLNPFVKKIRKSEYLAAVLDAVTIASIALIVTVCYEMSKDAITDWRTIAIAVLSFTLLFTVKKINSAIIVFLGSGLGYVFWLI